MELRAMVHLLKTEIEYFESVKEELLQHHEGKYVLVQGKKLVDTFDTPQAAYVEGIRLLQLTPFLIRRVTRTPEALQGKTMGQGLLYAHI